MKKLLFVCIAALMATAAFAQKYTPTANWPYLYPEFIEGELGRFGKKPNKALFNIHLNLGALHYVDNGKIREADILGVTGLTIGEDTFSFVGGKMLRVMAQTEGGCVVQENRGNYSAIVRNDGAYGTTSLNSTTTKTFTYNENAINHYNGYLLTDNYEELLAMAEDAETLPVMTTLYLVVGNEQIPANKSSVRDLEGIDKKAFSAFLKANKIKWDDPQDLIKVVEYLVSIR